MCGISDSAKSLITYCRENSRVCPLPPLWDALWKSLPDRKRVGRDWQPPPPVDFPGMPTPGILKMISLAEHIQWAAEHGALERVAAFLRGLREDEWIHLGD